MEDSTMNETEAHQQRQFDRIEAKVDTLGNRMAGMETKVAVIEERMTIPLRLFWAMVTMCIITITSAIIGTVMITQNGK